ncbi:MAG: hypothetical protein ACYTG0_26600 [Planctomycetota bacterium]|jgi:hypothetical protein
MNRTDKRWLILLPAVVLAALTMLAPQTGRAAKWSARGHGHFRSHRGIIVVRPPHPPRYHYGGYRHYPRPYSYYAWPPRVYGFGVGVVVRVPSVRPYVAPTYPPPPPRRYHVW